MSRVYIGLGSNLGNRIENIKSAVQFFDWDQRFENLEISSLYETLPYGKLNQEKFINCTVAFNTDMDVDALLNLTEELEKRIGRIKRDKWEPREIDIDILFYDNLIIETDRLSIPHKDLTNRDFVLVPLLELNSELIDPVSKKKLKMFLSQLNDKYIIDKINFNLN